MRIEFVITELEPGGAERALVTLATGLQRRGHQCHVTSIQPLPPPPRDQLLHALADTGVPTNSLDVHTPLQFLTARRRFGRQLDSRGIDIAQAFLHHANILLARTPTRVTVPRVAGYRVADPSRWRAWLERRHRSGWNHVIAVSNEVAAVIRQRIGIAQDSLSVIPNAVDLHRFQNAVPSSRESLQLPADSRIVLFVGRLHAQKGLCEFLPSLRDFLNVHRDHHLLVVGDGPQRNQLHTVIERLGLGNHVHLLGQREDIPSLMALANSLILPSRWEGMPNVVLEAMAAGLPVACFKTHGIPQLLGDATDRQAAIDGDYMALTKILEAIASDPALAADLALRNQHRASHFSIDRMIDAYESVYLRLCEDAAE